MDWFSLFIDKTLQEMSAARVIESLILLRLIWGKVKPHLEKIEARLAGVESAVETGFKAGELRFQRNERMLESHGELLLDFRQRISDLEVANIKKGNA